MGRDDFNRKTKIDLAIKSVKLSTIKSADMYTFMPCTTHAGLKQG
jgi:hypothetical protein